MHKKPTFTKQKQIENKKKFYMKKKTLKDQIVAIDTFFSVFKCRLFNDQDNRKPATKCIHYETFVQ